MAIVLVPPMFNLNHIKSNLERTITEQTGISATINGNIHFSLLGRATVVAHDVALPNGTVDSCVFSIPLSGMFNLQAAPLVGKIFINGANLTISGLIPPRFNSDIDIRDSVITFKNKDYNIVNGTLVNGMLRGVVRTDQHKYEFSAFGDEFNIKNNTNNLDIRGRLYSDGSASGTLSIDTRDINSWFEFTEPKVTERVKLDLNFEWNGEYGFKFSDIRGQMPSGDFTANIELLDDGSRKLEISSENINVDLSFLLNGTQLFHNTDFVGHLAGRIKLGNRYFKNVDLKLSGQNSEIIVTNIIVDDTIIRGGKITANGAENMHIETILDNTKTYCMFSGTPDNWQCSEFKHGDLYGSLSVTNNMFNAFVQSDKKMPSDLDFNKKSKILGDNGQVSFQFTDIGGTLEIRKNKFTPSYSFAKDKTLNWSGADLYFLPESMRTEIGDFTWDESGMSFVPHSGQWILNLGKDHIYGKNYFYINGKNAKDWFTNQDFQQIRNLEYTASGNFHNNTISNLEIKIAGQTFSGSVTGSNISLDTDLLNLDAFTNQDFIDNYEELQFLTGEPLLNPFSVNVNVSLSADRIIYNGDEFSNFVYSLKSGSQTFSITDSLRGNLLASITKKQNSYDINMKLNRFVISGNLLSGKMPLNISDTTITAEAELSTSGKIAYDIWHNLTGDIEISFDGGTLHGLGIDKFYSNVGHITRLNAESFLVNTLDGGTSQIKKLHIIGKYDGGNFTTSKPFTLSMRHTDVRGLLQINDGRMFAELDLILRGTSPIPESIELNVLPNGQHDYSLSQIMVNFDPDFLREFVATHDKF